MVPLVKNPSAPIAAVATIPKPTASTTAQRATGAPQSDAAAAARLRGSARAFTASTTSAAALDWSQPSHLLKRFNDRPACLNDARWEACRVLRMHNPTELQDYLAALVLSECVYKKLERSPEEVAHTISQFAAQFPPGWLQLQAIQISLGDISQHYLMAVGSDALYVAFMGTKQARDLVTDATIAHEAVWVEAAALAADKQSIPAAHRGFLSRSRAIPIEQLYELAISQHRRLVLCGHSLGGAVAKLCTLRLLRELPEWPAPALSCLCFATPAVGNSALAELVESAGWASHFKSYFMPEDQLMRMISFAQLRPTLGVAAANSAGPAGLLLGAAVDAAAAAEDTALGVPSALSQTSTTPPAVPAASSDAGAVTSTPMTALPEPLDSAASPPTVAAATRLSSRAFYPVKLLPRAGAAPQAGVKGALEAMAVRLPTSGSEVAPHSSSDAAAAAPLQPTAGSARAGLLAAGDTACAVEPSTVAELQAGRDILQMSVDEEAAMEEILSPGAGADTAVRLDQSARSGKRLKASAEAEAEAAADTTPPAGAANSPLHGGGLGSGTSGAAAAAKAAAPTPGAVVRAPNFGLMFALQRKRALRQVRRLAQQAHVPLPSPPVAQFHSFGVQHFLCAEGVKTGDELAGRVPPSADAAAAAAAVAAATLGAAESPPPSPPSVLQGPFSHHRMMAHRYRTLEMIGRVLAAHKQRHGRDAGNPARLPKAERGLGAGPLAAVTGALQPPLPDDLGSHTAVVLSDVLHPKLVVETTTARLPLLPPSARIAQAPSATATSRSGAASAPLSLPGSTPPPWSAIRPEALAAPGWGDLVRRLSGGSASTSGRSSGVPKAGASSGGGMRTVLIQVEGRNLQYARYASVRLNSVPVPTDTVQVVHDQAPGAALLLGDAADGGVGGGDLTAVHVHGTAAGRDSLGSLLLVRSALQNVAGGLAGGLGRMLGTPLAAAAAAGVPGLSQLAAATGCSPSGCSPRGLELASSMALRVQLPDSMLEPLQWGSKGQEAGQALPPLTLHLKSDFQELSCPISLQPHHVAVLGTTASAASLAFAALVSSAPPPPTPAAIGVGAPSTPAPVPRWWPTPVRWAAEQLRTRAAPLLAPGSTPHDPTSGAGRSTQPLPGSKASTRAQPPPRTPSGPPLRSPAAAPPGTGVSLPPPLGVLGSGRSSGTPPVAPAWQAGLPSLSTRRLWAAARALVPDGDQWPPQQRLRHSTSTPSQHPAAPLGAAETSPLEQPQALRPQPSHAAPHHANSGGGGASRSSSLPCRSRHPLGSSHLARLRGNAPVSQLRQPSGTSPPRQCHHDPAASGLRIMPAIPPGASQLPLVRSMGATNTWLEQTTAGRAMREASPDNTYPHRATAPSLDMPSKRSGTSPPGSSTGQRFRPLVAIRRRLQALRNGPAPPPSLPLVPTALSGGVQYHNLLCPRSNAAGATVTATTGAVLVPLPPLPVSPWGALRQLSLQLQSQGLQLGWWGWVVDGVQQLMRPAVLLAVLQSMRSVALPTGWHKLRRSPAALSSPVPRRQLTPQWQAVVLAATVGDELRMLRSRDAAALLQRAERAGMPILPVLLSWPGAPPGQAAAASEALACACRVPAAAVHVLELEEGLVRGGVQPAQQAAGLNDPAAHAGGAAQPPAAAAALWNAPGVQGLLASLHSQLEKVVPMHKPQHSVHMSKL